MIFRTLIAAVAGAVLTHSAAAQDALMPRLQDRIDILAAEPIKHGFQLGMLTSLRAIEKTLQTRYEYGLGDQLVDLPFLRVRFGSVNYAPKAAQSDTLAKMIDTALQDLETARAYLKAVEGQPTPFELTLQDVWFDVNADGQRDPEEDATTLVGAILLGQNPSKIASLAPMTVRFDESDHAWLTAYTHMLSGMGNLMLAFDPSPVFAQLEQQRDLLNRTPDVEINFDPQVLEAEIGDLIQKRSELEDAIATRTARMRTLRTALKKLDKSDPANAAQRKEIDAELQSLKQDVLPQLRREAGLVEIEIDAREARLPADDHQLADEYRPQLDALYVTLAALRQMPDVSRLEAVRSHFRAMIQHNRAFWAALETETDDDREWIPNPRQSSVIPVVLDDDMIAAWQDILQDGEDLLEGRLLLPHPLIPGGRGISLAAYFDDPAPLNLLDWLHGAGAYPYAARGPHISAQRWMAFQRLSGGNAGGLALLFN